MTQVETGNTLPLKSEEEVGVVWIIRSLELNWNLVIGHWDLTKFKGI